MWVLSCFSAVSVLVCLDGGLSVGAVLFQCVRVSVVLIPGSAEVLCNLQRKCRELNVAREVKGTL